MYVCMHVCVCICVDSCIVRVMLSRENLPDEAVTTVGGEGLGRGV